MDYATEEGPGASSYDQTGAQKLSQKRGNDETVSQPSPGSSESSRKRIKVEPKYDDQGVVVSEEGNHESQAQRPAANDDISTSNKTAMVITRDASDARSAENEPGQQDPSVMPLQDYLPQPRVETTTDVLGYPIVQEALDVAGSVCKKQLRSMQEQMETLKERINALEKENSNLRSKTFQEHTPDSIQRDIECDNCPKLRAQLEDAMKNLAIPRHIVPQSPIDEGSITNEWKTLMYAIRNLAKHQFDGHPFAKPSTTKDRELFARVTPNYPLHVASEMHKDRFFEAAIWRTMLDEFLGCPVLVYDTAVGRAVHRIQNLVFGSDEMYNRAREGYFLWRAQAGQILDRIHDNRSIYESQDGKMKNELRDKMIQRFSRYATSQKQESLQLSFESIIEKAIALAKSMTRSGPHYMFHSKVNLADNRLSGFPVDERVMDVVLELSPGANAENTVDFVIFPALQKFFTSPGDGRQRRKVITKARVCIFGEK
ncbi:hypothetical protein DL766_009144 [Monosporascus sp. MC13-8B]|uniref:Uncharacterized protein n=1 Tax=Monosporascus cannonballus TaxID=155416 RepID=A0ABY0GZ88_9PEZI|nr:hypothetical protein DL762_007404 [Monosporascus cannonballus]RYO81311.1 hypothetical protein DL763_008617 [Monosporascus cannonballus]RYP16360.1 hypothetical protein DL766_009144 [Monosporascus sp. MC13-8B]